MNLYKSRYTNIDYPEVVIYSLSHGRFKKYEDTLQMVEYVDYISQGITGLIHSGAEIIALAANSPHRVLNELKQRFDVPIISALDSACHEAQRLKIRKDYYLVLSLPCNPPFIRNGLKKGILN